MIRRLVEAVASVPPVDQWLGTIEDAAIAEPLGKILEDQAELRRMTEAGKAG